MKFCSLGMSCLLFPDIDGIEVNSYHRIEDVKTENLKSILFFETLKPFTRSHESIVSKTRESIDLLIESLDRNISLGGGRVRTNKTIKRCSPKQESILNCLILTFSGHRIKSSSIIFQTTNPSTYSSQLMQFRNGLDFDCNDWPNSMTIAFIFANRHNFSIEFSSAFQTIFPFVGIFGFHSNERMFGKCIAKEKSFHNKNNGIIDRKRNSVIVILNFGFRKL